MFSSRRRGDSHRRACPGRVRVDTTGSPNILEKIFHAACARRALPPTKVKFVGAGQRDSS
jgi:hypothetical protein